MEALVTKRIFVRYHLEYTNSSSYEILGWKFLYRDISQHCGGDESVLFIVFTAWLPRFSVVRFLKSGSEAHFIETSGIYQLLTSKILKCLVDSRGTPKIVGTKTLNSIFY